MAFGLRVPTPTQPATPAGAPAAEPGLRVPTQPPASSTRGLRVPPSPAAPPGNVDANQLASNIYGAAKNTVNKQLGSLPFNTIQRGGRGTAPPPPPEPPKDPYGTESGNTYAEDRYLNRLYGEDPAFNYAQKRGMEALGTASSAAGNFNSGAARQQEGDFNANLIAQSQAQLDALASGASGARQAKQNSIYQTGLGLAGGQAGTGGAYDLKSADTGNKFLDAIIQMYIGKAGVDSKSSQQGIGNAIGIGSLFA